MKEEDAAWGKRGTGLEELVSRCGAGRQRAGWGWGGQALPRNSLPTCDRGSLGCSPCGHHRAHTQRSLQAVELVGDSSSWGPNRMAAVGLPQLLSALETSGRTVGRGRERLHQLCPSPILLLLGVENHIVSSQGLVPMPFPPGSPLYCCSGTCNWRAWPGADLEDVGALLALGCSGMEVGGRQMTGAAPRGFRALGFSLDSQEGAA